MKRWWGLKVIFLAAGLLEARDTLTGDWNGRRPSGEKNGVDIFISYTDDFLGNPIGGREQGIANAASTGLKFVFDFEKIAGAKGLSLVNSYAWRFGTNLSAKKIDNQFNVATVYGGETYKLNELYLQQKIFHNKVLFKAGRMEPSADFLYSPVYSRFVSLAFNSNPIAILFNTPFTDYPFATWSACLHLLPHPAFLMKFGVYNNNANVKRNKYHGCYFPFKSTQGVLLIAEGVGMIKGKCQGNYYAGWYYVTGETALFKGGEQKGNWGYYFLFDQRVYKGLTPFGALLFSPTDRNQFPLFLEGGLVYVGPISSRPEDCIAFGVAYGNYSSELRKVQREAKASHLVGAFGSRPETFETVIELNYSLQLKKWLVLTPDLQYIVNPKGLGLYNDALVVGFQLSIAI